MSRDPCDVGSYDLDPQCDLPGRYRTFVRSRHDGEVREIDFVCHGHRARILDIKRNLYVTFGLPVPDMWYERIGEFMPSEPEEGWPRWIDGTLTYACCVSTIDQPCHHKSEGK